MEEQQHAVTRAKNARSSDDDRALVDTQNWSSYSHRELYEAVHRDNDPGRVGELAGDWARLGIEMSESAQRMGERLRSTEHGWQGEAGDSARGAIHEIATWTSEAGATANGLGARIEEQGRVMETAKMAMPEPVDVDLDEDLTHRFNGSGGQGSVVDLFTATVDQRVRTIKSADAHQDAVQVMERMESDSRVLDGDTPRFAPPPDPVRQEQHQGTPPADGKLTPFHRATPAHEAGEDVQQLGEPVTPGGADGDLVTRKMPVLGDPAAGDPAATDPASRVPTSNIPAATDPANALAPEQPQIPQVPQSPSERGGPIPRPGDPQIPVGGTPTPRSVPSGRTPTPRTPSPPNFDPPTVKFKPSGTTPQSTKPSSVPNPSSPDITGRDTYKPPRPVSGPDAPTAITPNPFAKNPGGGPGSGGPGGSRGGWGGSIPPIPGTTGGSGGALGAGGAGSGGSASGGSGPGAGGRAGVGSTGGPAAGRPVGAAGVPGQAGAAGMGGGAPGQANRGKGGEDQERRAKYVESAPIVEVPGADLPPPVIGGGKPKKKDKDKD
ncbi:PPE domain-containing protein [Saccharopolyspora sp. NPDC047091]|uniref:PPE domain-containing protein n=1 Tax=Saccharopolyspora sp. NPDC047091 TaxID=3155924 RepID=UPI0033F3D7E5